MLEGRIAPNAVKIEALFWLDLAALEAAQLCVADALRRGEPALVRAWPTKALGAGRLTRKLGARLSKGLPGRRHACGPACERLRRTDERGEALALLVIVLIGLHREDRTAARAEL